MSTIHICAYILEYEMCPPYKPNECESHDQCYYDSNHCNGYNECDDGSDELNCPGESICFCLDEYQMDLQDSCTYSIKKRI